MNASKNLIKQQWQEQEAVKRFQMIAPLLRADLDPAAKLQLRKRISDENGISIRSLYRYEKAFLEGQFSALKPMDREKHRSQRLPENFDVLLEQALEEKTRHAARMRLMQIREQQILYLPRWHPALAMSRRRTICA